MENIKLAREICAIQAEAPPYRDKGLAKEFRDGYCDDQFEVRAVLRALNWHQDIADSKHAQHDSEERYDSLGDWQDEVERRRAGLEAECGR